MTVGFWFGVQSCRNSSKKRRSRCPGRASHCYHYITRFTEVALLSHSTQMQQQQKMSFSQALRHNHSSFRPAAPLHRRHSTRCAASGSPHQQPQQHQQEAAAIAVSEEGPSSLDNLGALLGEGPQQAPTAAVACCSICPFSMVSTLAAAIVRARSRSAGVCVASLAAHNLLLLSALVAVLPNNSVCYPLSFLTEPLPPAITTTTTPPAHNNKQQQTPRQSSTQTNSWCHGGSSSPSKTPRLASS